MTDFERLTTIRNTFILLNRISKEELLASDKTGIKYMFFFILRKNVEVSTQLLARWLGYSNGKKVSEGIKRFKEMIEDDPEYRKTYAITNSIIIKLLEQPARKRYYDIVHTAIKAFIYDQLKQRDSKSCFLGSYVKEKTELENTGWHQILLNKTEGYFDDDDEITPEDQMCYDIIPYSDEEKKVLLNKFDMANSIFAGMVVAADAAYYMEDWSDVEERVSLINMIKEKELLDEVLNAYS